MYFQINLAPDQMAPISNYSRRYWPLVCMLSTAVAPMVRSELAVLGSLDGGTGREEPIMCHQAVPLPVGLSWGHWRHLQRAR